MEFYRKTEELRRDHADRAWKTIKNYILLASSIIAVFVDFIEWENFKPSALVYLWLIPILLAYISRIMRRNFKRECERLYETIAILKLIEIKSVSSLKRVKKITLKTKPNMSERR